MGRYRNEWSSDPATWGALGCSGPEAATRAPIRVVDRSRGRPSRRRTGFCKRARRRTPLSAIIPRRNGLPVETAFRNAIQIVDAVARAHQHDIVRCDQVLEHHGWAPIGACKFSTSGCAPAGQRAISDRPTPTRRSAVGHLGARHRALRGAGGLLAIPSRHGIRTGGGDSWGPAVATGPPRPGRASGAMCRRILWATLARHADLAAALNDRKSGQLPHKAGKSPVCPSIQNGQRS
jgi:hypothetical protein